MTVMEKSLDPKEIWGELKVFADADYGMSHDRRSTTGFVIFLNGGPIAWGSRVQKVIALSTAESEVIAATDTCKEVVHFRLVFSELGYADQSPSPTNIFEDNVSCVEFAKDMRSRKTAKHYEIRLKYLQSVVQQGFVRFTYIPSSQQVADIFTKPLPGPQFRKLRDQLMGKSDLEIFQQSSEEKSSVRR
jgi:hypothetical protein